MLTSSGSTNVCELSLELSVNWAVFETYVLLSCSPAHVMPLLEIVRTEKTSPQIIVDLLDVGKKIKKTPVVVGNCTGFAVNRIFFPYTQAALLLVERGTDPYRIDSVISKFGMPMGPFRFANEVDWI